MTTTGWFVLIGLAILIIFINFGLSHFLGGRHSLVSKGIIRRVSHTIRNPWFEEEEQFSELARRVGNLKDPLSSDKNDNK